MVNNCTFNAFFSRLPRFSYPKHLRINKQKLCSIPNVLSVRGTLKATIQLSQRSLDAETNAVLRKLYSVKEVIVRTGGRFDK